VGGFAIEEVEVDDPDRGEVQVAIRASGLCHTDVSMLGDVGRVILGHEGAGVVSAIGAGVTSVQVGDPVILNWARSCRECEMCVAGLTNLCRRQIPVHEGAFRPKSTGEPIGAFFGLGTMSTLTLVHERAVTPLRVEMPWPSACLLGCCVMTGFGSVINVAKPEPGASVAVIGTGAVGLCAVQGARYAGAAKIIAVDVNDTKLEAATSFGATHTILVQPGDDDLRYAAALVVEMTAGGVDLAFESTAVPRLLTAPLLFIRDGGTAIQISGSEEQITIDGSAFFWDKQYLTSLYGRCDPQRDFALLQRLYADGQLEIDALVSRTYPLVELRQAIDDLLDGKNVKAVLLPE